MNPCIAEILLPNSVRTTASWKSPIAGSPRREKAAAPAFRNQSKQF